MKKTDNFTCSYLKNKRCLKGMICGGLCSKYALCRFCKHEGNTDKCNFCEWLKNNPHI